MSQSSLTDLVASSAVQLAALPQGLWNLASQRTLPQKPNKNDRLHAGVQTAVGGFLGMGISAFMQTLETRGAAAALTGVRLGWTELNWSAVGSALVVGAAVGACIGIATYLSREGNRAKKVSAERLAPTSQSNVSLKKMETMGPDAWAINRILEKDPKASGRLETATALYVQTKTHAHAKDVHAHATVALASAMLQKAGQFEPKVWEIKSAWLESKQKKYKSEAPCASVLLETLSKLPPTLDSASIVDMHASWTAMVNKESNQERAAFNKEFSQWADRYFKKDHISIHEASSQAFVQLRAIQQDPMLNAAAAIEYSQMQSLVMGMLIGAHVEPAAPNASKASKAESVFNTPSLEV